MREYPGRLYHKVPEWVHSGSSFHIRLRVDPNQSIPLTDCVLAQDLLDSARRYHDLGHWWCDLFLLMPDHVHAILSFPSTPGMSETLRSWKRASRRLLRVQWQAGYFDHRLRTAAEAGEKWTYIRLNPVVKNLCRSADEWPWRWSSITENPGGAACPKTLD